ncbi:PIN domain-containing protein [Roseibacillus persicicus]|uniref:PIN domain-containing protein n=1 Tax=Roseibacillus persicicus TaxID=454148 RepID=UPI00280E2362|nr:PIN domain-containing protein [Roseibacillus persicicus]MDQ8191875.1 hypothetical protein [Roseibacillus persicicus]
MKIALDSSVLVAALVPEQDFHLACRVLLKERHERSTFSHALVETFNTVTGGRLGVRLAASEAEGLIGVILDRLIQPVSLSPRDLMRAFGEAEARGVRGGAIYDFLHLVAARKAKSEFMVTLNLRHFQAFWREGDPMIRHPEELA